MSERLILRQSLGCMSGVGEATRLKSEVQIPKLNEDVLSIRKIGRF